MPLGIFGSYHNAGTRTGLAWTLRAGEGDRLLVVVGVLGPFVRIFVELAWGGHGGREDSNVKRGRRVGLKGARQRGPWEPSFLDVLWVLRVITFDCVRVARIPVSERAL